MKRKKLGGKKKVQQVPFFVFPAVVGIFIVLIGIWAIRHSRLFLSRAAGTNYYVASEGNDTNPGTADRPWKTVAKVNGMRFQAGDTVYFKRGQAWTETLTIKSSGAQNAPVIFTAYGAGTRPIIPGINITNFHYITLKELHVKGGQRFGINLYGGNYVTIEDTEVEGAPVSANIFVGLADYTIIRRVKSHHAAEHGLYIASEEQGGTEYPLVEDSEFYDNDDAGIQLNSSVKARVIKPVIRRNYVHGNGIGINDLASDQGEFTNNVLANNRNAELYIAHDKNYGTVGEQFSSINSTYAQNVIYNHTGLAWGDVVFINHASDGTKFYNNIVDVPGTVRMYNAAGADNLDIRNNFYSATGTFGLGTKYYSTLSTWRATGRDTGSLSGDPKFVDPTTGNFSLQANSPAAGKGLVTTLVPSSTAQPVAPAISSPSPETVTVNMIKNASFTGSTLDWKSPWRLNVYSGAQATLTKETGTTVSGANSALVTISRAGTAQKHVQLTQSNLAFAAGQRYRITFWVKADGSRPVEVMLQNPNSPFTAYFTQTVTVSQSWSQQVLYFRPQTKIGISALRFHIGSRTGKVWFSDVRLEAIQ